MIHYRCFRNDDPPRVVRLWNTALAGPRAVPLPGQGTTLLEYFTFSKPYFDPAGLILACDGREAVGLVHAGHAARTDGRPGLDPSRGVICAIGVAPDHRHKGVGAELLRRAEGYLRDRGATTVLAGPLAPDNPFTFGLYGGATSAGFLESHPKARPFFEAHGYRIARSSGVFRRSLENASPPNDSRFGPIRARYEIIATPYRGSWWAECVLGPIEAVAYRLEDKATRELGAQVILWDMDVYYPAWGVACVGLVDLTVPPGLRRQGLAKYLLSQVMRHLRDQPFHLLEARADLDNPAAVGLLRSLQFDQVEVGHCYRREG